MNRLSLPCLLSFFLLLEILLPLRIYGGHVKFERARAITLLVKLNLLRLSYVFMLLLKLGDVGIGSFDLVVDLVGLHLR